MGPIKSLPVLLNVLIIPPVLMGNKKKKNNNNNSNNDNVRGWAKVTGRTNEKSSPVGAADGTGQSREGEVVRLTST